jgi:hypothetical protein
MLTSHATIVFTDGWSAYVPELPQESEHVFLDNDMVGIDEVRTITAEAYRRPTQGTLKYIIVRTPKVTVEAQQALLKTLEEPPLSTAIVLVVPVGTSVLATILSRVATEYCTDTIDNSVFTAWLAAPLAERMERIEAAAKDKDEQFFTVMAQGLRSYLHIRRRELDVRTYASAKQVLELLRTRGASNKMLLEELALSLPVSSR